MRHYFDCLQSGLLIAIDIDSRRRKAEAELILQKALEKNWHKEQKYKDLAELLVRGRP